MEVTWLELVSKFSFLNKTSILQKTTNKFYAEKKEAELSSMLLVTSYIKIIMKQKEKKQNLWEI